MLSYCRGRPTQHFAGASWSEPAAALSLGTSPRACPLAGFACGSHARLPPAWVPACAGMTWERCALMAPQLGRSPFDRLRVRRFDDPVLLPIRLMVSVSNHGGRVEDCGTLCVRVRPLIRRFVAKPGFARTRHLLPTGEGRRNGKRESVNGWRGGCGSGRACRPACARRRGSAASRCRGCRRSCRQ